MLRRSILERGSVPAVRPIRALPLLVFALLVVAPLVSPAQPAAPAPLPSPAPSQGAEYVDALIEKAHSLRLHEDPYWRTLLHYKGGLFGFRSLVDDPKFFLAERGKHEPGAELDATIRAFFSPVVEGERHAVCRFPGRLDWLKSKLSIDESRLPLPRCEAFEELMERIDPKSVTLIFPASHMNSPASMYGHTLLTIRTDDGTDLLAYAVNYSALTTETFGPFYIVKGLFGRYKGYFSILPYYAKLQEYSDVSDRDIWEYPLDLNEQEVRRLLLHVYEMQEIYADYFFFSENCSYDLLFLLDAARPGLHLTDECAWWVIPLDTIREVKKSGLIREAVYRPSRSTKVKHLASLLTETGRRQALGIVDGALDPEAYAQAETPIEERVKVCDLASEYLQYRYAKRDLTKAEYVERFMKTLNARSALGATVDEEERRIPAPARPDEGHHSNRVSVGFGAREDEPFAEIRLRPAYHSLIDNTRGYKPGSQIVFTDFVVRYATQARKARLESVDLIDIVSIAPRDAFFKHTSWKLRTDLFRRAAPDGREPLVYRLNPGFGRAFESRALGLCYVFLETEVHVGGALHPDYSLGAGGSIGIVKSLTERWKLHLTGADIYHGVGDKDHRIEASLGQNVQIHREMSFSAEVTGRWNDHDSHVESMFRWNAFF